MRLRHPSVSDDVATDLFEINRAFEEEQEPALPSTGSQVEKVTAGEYSVGFVMGSPALTAEQRADGLIKAVFPDDGTPLLRRGMSMLQGAPHPVTTKLLTDFVLSADGGPPSPRAD
ncbi:MULTISPECIES: hypothetical protein [Rhodococcus]|uniref:Extracellular solute-binding protein n=1 Tax=Rhodococcus opacus RKJ300 = JCM 13270 TaxID=1165867 RepID=I0WS89_RHOOP|nr:MULTISPECIES: hypothetical protein [Rhodococcus]EID79255.1 extracellular solute-binding protein [Rhodococcus opacus RKJ300 = JCM 13270]QQZ16552.1 hypothetical protein GO592_10450 [Rhodococcus sp. 21391]